MTKLSLYALYATVGISSSFVFGASPASALTIFLNNSTNQPFGAATEKSFSNGDVTLTFKPTAGSPQSYVTSSGSGLCLYANTNGTSGFTPCNLSGSTIENPLTYNNSAVTANKPLLFTGGNISQLATPTSGGSPTFGDIFVRYTANGTVLGTIATASTGAFTFSTPIALNLGQELIFTGSGNNSSVRLSSFTVEDAPAPVPGPLPLLGAAAAFGWSRKLRKKIKLTP